MSEMKRCFCCGSSCIYETFEIDSLGTQIPVIFCNSCKIVFKVENDSPCLDDDETYSYLKEKNAKAWNTRKPVDDVVERLEKKIKPLHNANWNAAMEEAIEIIKEGMMRCE